MKKTILICLAALLILLAGCGGGGGETPAPAPTNAPAPTSTPTAAPAPTAAPENTASDGDFAGNWEYWDMVLQIMDGGTWRLDHEGETDEVSSGVWSASSGKATLFFSDGSSVFAEFEREGDKLIENDGEEHLSWDAWLAVRPEAPAADDGMAELCGIWEDPERGGYLELEDSGFWAHYNDQGGWTSSGPWKVENGQVLLYDNNTDELVRELGIAVSGDLLDGEGGRLTPAEGVETPWAGIEAYVGNWEYLDWEGAMLELRYDDTWTLYLDGEILQEGTWAIYNGYAYTYDDEGAYNTTLTPDVGGLIADGEYLVPSAGADYDEEADAAAWAEIASLDGYWYENGDFDAEEYLSIINGEWSFQSFSSGEPEELAAGTIVPSAGEPHAFYARSGESDEAFYFRYSPAEENDTGSDLIYWDNDAFLFMRLE